MKNVLAGFALAASLTGCYVQGRATVEGPPPPVATVEVEEEPPAPRYETIEVRPGFVWIGGRWARSGNRWVWRGGYYERERVGYSWEAGRWERRGNRHVWVEGRWRGGGGPVVRDHR
ncbi:MAG: hypothetical protein QM831_16410 [Kofleriaceae bacterium]